MRFYLKRTVSWVVLILSILVTIDWVLLNSSSPSFTDKRQLSLRKRKKPDVFNSSKIVDLHTTRNKSDYIGNLQVISRGNLHETSQGISNLIWPNRFFYDNDRIVNQLKFKLNNQSRTDGKQPKNIPMKMIFIDSGFSDKPSGRTMFLEDKCNVDTCEITRVRKYSKNADAIFFQSSMRADSYQKSPKQIWIIFMLESPYNTFALKPDSAPSLFNWTATYRHDSDIVAPYEKFVRYDDNIKFLPQNKSYAQNKSKKVAWFVSNCGARNQRREYARELSKYIRVDIYGQCGTLKCPRKDHKCFEMLNTDYKFYLAFENSNCRDYITEKFFVTGLQ
jgi:hypothetical protein